MGYFPFYIDIKDKICLVVGGGTVALRKVEKLLLFNPKITVVSPEIHREITNLPNVTVIKRKFKDSDINNAFMVITATDDNALNSHIFELCTAKNILVNTVDDRDKCGFIFPALIKNDSVTIGISTSGKCPIYSRYLREKIEKSYDKDFKIADKLGEYRLMIKDKISTEAQRKALLQQILDIYIDNENPDEKEVLKIIEES
ncbi:MAG: bifunctional precorrin-2 dehydrogenase/sirohydrochlorin ferrochelatase [Ruminococcus sp.]|nr:bifunctional precorrin-2 dehydrogenase/sirohydrochlorin ferrochelatase [Ruminococcus sp.]